MSVSKDLVDIIKGSDDKGTKAYDTPGTVTRVDGSTVWVHIPGGVDETPVKRTINAKEGDTVQVRVSGGSAWLNGNASAPPTDDTQANIAVEYALVANNAADSAVRSAKDASEAAADAKSTADSVHDIAVQAQTDADTAQRYANVAYNSASEAIYQLSVVEDIIGILDLIADHGVYGLTQDTEIKPDKWYFTVTGNAVVNPTGNPNLQGWYEESDGVYFLTEDTTVQVGTTYYTLTVSPVIAPDVSDIGTYYELVDIDTAIQNYVSSHLVLVNDTLSLQNGATRVSLSTNAANGLTFYNDGQQVAQYGSDAVIGDPNSFHITITSNYQGTGNPRISFYNNSSNEVAYISGDMLYITKTVVIQQMDVGDEDGQWSWKIHKVNGANNLYLKWLG